MKLIIVFQFFVFVTLYANGFSQSITFSCKDLPLKKVFIAIEKQTDFVVFYNKDLLQKTMPVSVSVTNMPVADFLTELLRNQPLDFTIEGKTIMLSGKPVTIVMSSKQEIKKEKLASPLTIRVIDPDGKLLPGASVSIKSQSLGATNAEGTVNVNVSAGDILLITYVGYDSKEITVTADILSRGSIEISLNPKATLMDQMVVIGYGSQSKRNVTGSHASIDVKKLEDLPTTNVAQALRGRVAGVQFLDNGRPGQGGNILVRGQRSISAGNDPLIVLDGIIFEGTLADINPDDIDAIDILKDASATAIYGYRAANGVILITSKKGTTEKPLISFNGYYGTNSWSHTPKLLSPERYLEKTLDWRRDAGLEADPAKVANYLTQTEARNYNTGNIIDPWQIASQTSSTQYYDVSVSGKANRTNYFVSGNYTNEKGLVFNDNATRKSVRVNLNTQIVDWLKFGINAMYAERDLSGNEADMGTAMLTSPYNDVWADSAKTDPIPLGNEDGLVGSIIFNAIINRNQERQRNLFSNFYAIVEPVKGLTYRVNYAPNFRWYDLNNFGPIYRRNGLNRTGSASRRSDFTRTWVLENILGYNTRIGDDHHLEATLMFSRNQVYNESLVGTGSDFTGASDATGWNNLSLAKVQTTTSSASRIDAVSTMARLNYRFKNRYLLTLTGRRDGSSVFGANNKYGNFPSAAIAWIASEESFLRKVSAIDLLKLRVSYGSVGNQAIGAYQSLTRQGQVQYVFGDGSPTYTGLYPVNLANPNLGWETTTTTNVGVDFNLLKGRIGGTVEWYNMDTEDLLLTRQLPVPTGFQSILTNVGATNNKGWEITLNTINIETKKFEWASTVVFSTNKNKIVHLYNSDVNNDGKEDDDVSNRWFIGQPISVAYDYALDGVYQVGDQIPTGQKPGFYRMQDYNGDKIIDANDRHVLGTLQPKYRWSVTNNLKYGQFSFMLVINALQGWMGVNNLLRLDNALPNGNYPMRAANFLDAGWWTPENKSNTRSSLTYTNPYGHYIYQSRDFIRIQEFSLAYDFPQRLINPLKLQNLRVYVSGRNLYTFTKWQGMDPESGSYYYPTARTISFGLNMSL